MNQKSPFEQWRENHLYQIAVSPEILKLIAEAFQGGRLYEMKPFQNREWAGLTDEETERLIHNFGSDPHTLLDEVDARLKARNT